MSKKLGVLPVALISPNCNYATRRATSNDLRRAIIQLVQGVQGYGCGVNCCDVISFFPFLSHRKNSLLLLSALLSPLFFWKHLTTVRRTRLPIKSMPRKEGTLLWGARGQSFEFLFSRVSWKIPLNVYPRLRIVPRLFWNGRKVSIAGVWPFLTGQREGGRERMEREKSRNGRYFSCKEEKPLCHRIFHFSKSFAIYFHVSRFFHLWSRDTKYGGKSERLKRFKSLESKTLPGWFLRRWVRERKRDFLFFFFRGSTGHDESLRISDARGLITIRTVR